MKLFECANKAKGLSSTHGNDVLEEAYFQSILNTNFDSDYILKIRSDIKSRFSYSFHCEFWPCGAVLVFPKNISLPFS